MSGNHPDELETSDAACTTTEPERPRGRHRSPAQSSLCPSTAGWRSVGVGERAARAADVWPRDDLHTTYYERKEGPNGHRTDRNLIVGSAREQVQRGDRTGAREKHRETARYGYRPRVHTHGRLTGDIAAVESTRTGMAAFAELDGEVGGFIGPKTSSTQRSLEQDSSARTLIWEKTSGRHRSSKPCADSGAAHRKARVPHDLAEAPWARSGPAS